MEDGIRNDIGAMALGAGADPATVGELGLPAVTAFVAIQRLDLGPEMRVLIQGGASAVGLMAIALCIRERTHVVATSRAVEKFAAMQKAGADECVCTREPDWPTRFDPVDRVIDLVGQATFGPTVARLSDGGRLVFVGGTSGAEVTFSAWDLMRPVTLTGYSSESLTRPELVVAITEIATLQPIEVTSFPLREAARAHTALESGRSAGRFVLRAH